MALPKLIYLDITAFGEPIRYIFHYSGTEFKDVHITNAVFGPTKQSFPFGKVPILEIDGKIVHQSVAICRYMAKKTGLAGSDDWESFQCDIAVDTISDMREAMAGFHYENHDEAKTQKREIVMSTTVPYYLEKFEAIIKENGGFFVGGKLTWADFWFVGLIDYFNFMAGSDVLFKSPELKSLKERIQALPAIQKYIANRAPVRY